MPHSARQYRQLQFWKPLEFCFQIMCFWNLEPWLKSRKNMKSIPTEIWFLLIAGICMSWIFCLRLAATAASVACLNWHVVKICSITPLLIEWCTCLGIFFTCVVLCRCLAIWRTCWWFLSLLSRAFKKQFSWHFFQLQSMIWHWREGSATLHHHSGTAEMRWYDAFGQLRRWHHFLWRLCMNTFLWSYMIFKAVMRWVSQTGALY